MRKQVFFILSFYLLECHSLSLSLNRDVAQEHCGAVVEAPPVSESPKSCDAPAEKNYEIAVVTIEDPSSSFFVHFRGDKKRDDSVKNYCGKPIIKKKVTGLDSEGIALKKIIKRESPIIVDKDKEQSLDDDVKKIKITSEDDEASVVNDNENEIFHSYDDDISDPDFVIQMISGLLGFYESLRKGVVSLHSMNDNVAQITE